MILYFVKKVTGRLLTESLANVTEPFYLSTQWTYQRREQLHSELALRLRRKEAIRIISTFLPKAAVFNPFHLMAHVNYLLKFCGSPKKICFLPIWQKIQNNFGSFTFDSSHWAGCCHFFFFFSFDNLREKRSVPLNKQSGIARFKILRQTGWKSLA